MKTEEEIKQQVKEITKQFKEIANKNALVLLPRFYYEKLFNNVEYLKSELKKCKKSRDSWKNKYLEEKGK